MDLEEILHDLLKELLDKMDLDYTKIEVTEEEKGNFLVNIISDNPSLLIGHKGDNIQAIQHVLKVLAWKNFPNQEFTILLDIDGYRKRQEENVVSMADRKVDYLRKSGRPQSLPPMSPYLRRKVHLHLMNAGYDDIETFSKDEAEFRHIVIKLKS